jgi:hypothetical protein
MVGHGGATLGTPGGAVPDLRPVHDAVVVGDLHDGSIAPAEDASPFSGPPGDGVQIGTEAEILRVHRGQAESLVQRWQQLQGEAAWHPSSCAR